MRAAQRGAPGACRAEADQTPTEGGSGAQIAGNAGRLGPNHRHRWIKVHPIDRTMERNYICLDCGEPGFDTREPERRMPRWLRNERTR